jgi:hypothetical protein
MPLTSENEVIGLFLFLLDITTAIRSAATEPVAATFTAPAAKAHEKY